MIIVSSMFFIGCKTYSSDVPTAFKRPASTIATDSEYRFMPADMIGISCAKIFEINNISQTIRTDGKINLEGIGDVMVAGKTSEEIAAILKKRYSGLYNLAADNVIAIKVMHNANKLIFITGEVTKKTPLQYTGHDSAIEFIYNSIPYVTAELKHVRVIRPSTTEGKSLIFEINMRDVINNGDTSQDVLLEAGDIVYIPPTPLAAIGNLVAEIVRPIGLALSPMTAVAQIANY